MCWTEALSLVDITAATIGRPFVSGWISCFGILSTITTDCEHLMELLGSARICTTVYHPISRGMVELFHRQLKAVFKAYPNSTL